MKRRSSNEYKNFESLVSGLMKVPHADVKAKLEEEQKIKDAKKKQKKANP